MGRSQRRPAVDLPHASRFRAAGSIVDVDRGLAELWFEQIRNRQRRRPTLPRRCGHSSFDKRKRARSLVDGEAF